jgi:glycosyltransferase involved in cell wall biosynthesis
MKILQVHNYYQFSGGEDSVLENEKRLLESKGNSVFQFIKENKEINGYSLLKKANLFNRSVWSKESFHELKELIKKVKPDICHVHNYMPLISPSVFSACREMKVPVLQTLHNYRMLCANANLFRDGEVCEECIGKSLYHGVKYGCYRSSRVQTFAVARMIESNKKKGMWDGGVDGYIALTNFSKNKFIKEGMPAAKIFVKPNFLFEDPGYSGKDENYFFFAGRLDETKGIDVLIEAANELPGVKFKVAGDGPLKEKVTAVPNIEYLGQLKKNELLEYIKSSTALVFPSKSYETFGLSIIEAFACYKPVIGSKLGAMAEIIEEGKTGLLFEPGSAKALVEKIEWAIKNKDEMKQMGINARKEYEEKYSAEKNYEMLMYIYNNL